MGKDIEIDKDRCSSQVEREPPRQGGVLEAR